MKKYILLFLIPILLVLLVVNTALAQDKHLAEEIIAQQLRQKVAQGLSFESTLKKEAAILNLTTTDILKIKEVNVAKFYNIQNELFSELAKNPSLAQQIDQLIARQKSKITALLMSELTQYKLNPLDYEAKKNNQYARLKNISGNNTVTATCVNNCDNAGFEIQDFTNWDGGFGAANATPSGGLNIGTTNCANSDASVHNIVTTGNDEICGFPRVCNLISSNTTSVRLGNSISGTSENLVYSFTVDGATPYFTYYYAVVLEDPGSSHSGAEKPAFWVDAYDVNNNLVPCAHYYVNASVSGFEQTGSFKFRRWTAVTIPLNAYVGQCIKVVFTTKDCTPGGSPGSHSGYAYIDADCGSPQIDVPGKICGKKPFIIHGPPGFAAYQWVGPGIVGASDRDSLVLNTAGNYSLTLTTRSDPPCTITIDTVVYGTPNPPIAQFTTSVVCLEDSTHFTNTSTPVNFFSKFHWDYLNDGSVDDIIENPSHLFTSAGTFPVKLTVENSSCLADTVLNITVNPKPTADAGLPKEVCSGTQTQLVGTGGDTYKWYATTDMTTVISNTDTYNTTPVNATTSVADTLTDVLNYTLIVTNNYGCKDTDNVDLTVNPLPVATFTNNTACLTNPTNFTNTSYFIGANTDQVFWTFEPNQTSQLKAPTYTYPTCGNKTVTLVITTAKACVGTITNAVDVNCNPVANFSALNICQSDSASFSNTSTNAIGYVWDFETVGTIIDNESIIKDPKHFYTVSGTYSVSLIASTAQGCLDTIQKNITIYPMPTASFTVTDVCFNQNTDFTSTSIVGAPDNIAIYSWDYNKDNNPEQTGAQSTAQHQYATLYNDSATLTVSTNHGCRDTAIHKINVYPLPVASYTYTNACLTFASVFDAKASYVSSGTIDTYDWDLGDSTSASGDSVNHIYPNTGYYKAILTTTTNFGCVDTQLKVVTAYPNPTVDFSVDKRKGCQPLCVKFDDLSTIQTSVVPTQIVDYKWVFGSGDSTASNTGDVNYCYTVNGGMFDVSLEATSNYGCKTKLSKTGYIEVFPKPTAHFFADPLKTTVNSPVITIIDSSLLADKIEWNFGDSKDLVSEMQHQFWHTYKDSGIYTITQYVTTIHECKDTFLVEMFVGPEWGIYIPNVFTPNDDGKNEYFNAKYYGIVKYELTIFNRWGNVVNVIDLNSPGWDGTDFSTGTMSQTDVYIWQLRFTTVFGKKFVREGTVTLLK